MKNSLFLIFIVFVLVVAPISLAVELNIQTLPNHRISAFFREPEKLINIDSVHIDTGTGDVVITSDIYNGNEMDLVLTLKKDGETILNRMFNGLSTDKIIYINFIPGLSEEEMLIDNFKNPEVQDNNLTNNTISEDVEKIENKTDEVKEEKSNSVATTGKSVEDNEKILDSKIIFYILGFIAGLFFLFFIIQTYRRRIGSSDNYKIIKYGRSDEKKIADAERKLVEAKMELDEIKGRKKKLIEAKERFQKDRDELKKLGVEDFY